MKKYFVLILFAFLLSNAHSQVSLAESEAKLANLFNMLKSNQSKEECQLINQQIEQALSQALQNPLSFNYPFDSIPFLGKIYSDDALLRIYTWNIPFQDGTYTYGGFIQQQTGNIISFLKMKDVPYKPSNDKQVKLSNWYGALYYQAFSVHYRKTTYYVLLGWAGNNDLTNYKIIDILSLNDKTGMMLGLPVFENQNKTFSRIIFEYGSQNKMTLDYDSKKKQIVFDHLSPSSSKYEGIYSDYGPDFSYDSYQLNKKDWVFKEDIDVRNKE